jgi:hypothetical protein
LRRLLARSKCSRSTLEAEGLDLVTILDFLGKAGDEEGDGGDEDGEDDEEDEEVESGAAGPAAGSEPDSEADSAEKASLTEELFN